MEGVELVVPPRQAGAPLPRGIHMRVLFQRADVPGDCWDSHTGSRGSNGDCRGRLLAQTLLFRIANTRPLLPRHGEGGTLWECWTFSQHLYTEVVSTLSSGTFKYARNKVKKMNIRREVYQEQLSTFREPMEYLE